MSNPTATVVVPVRNMEGRLFSLQQWLRETDPEAVRVIIVCNGTTDGTYIELLNFIKEFNLTNVEIISSDISGAGPARQIGLDSTTTEYILFWDSDDIGRIKEVHEVLAEINKSSQMIICRYSLMNVSTKQINSPKEIRGNTLSKMTVFSRNPGLWRIIFKTEFVKECRFGSSNMGEDQVFIADVLSRDPVIEFNNSVIYQYHLGVDGQLTSRKELFSGISNSLSEIREIVTRTKCANIEAVTVQFVSLAATLFRKGTNRDKLVATLHLLGFFFKGMVLEPKSSKKFMQKFRALRKLV